MMNRLCVSFLLIFSIKLVHVNAYNGDPTSTCGYSGTSLTKIIESRIIGGETVRGRAWSWIVSLQLNEVHQCAATLLTEQFAITAAHCIFDHVNASNYSILAGTNNLLDRTNTISQRRIVQEIYRHPDFDQSIFSHDVALIRFASLSITLNSTWSVICLPEYREDPFEVDANLVIIGWGLTSLFDRSYSNFLQQVTVQSFTSNSYECQRTRRTDQTQHFCAGVIEGGKDSCQGDSGGPIMSFVNNRWVLAGITSSGVSCALPGYPGLYTRVSTFIPFIQSIVDIRALTIAKPLNLKVPENTGYHLRSSFSISICLFFLYLYFTE